MSQRIRKAAVLGSGVMGSGIAAHLANAGIPVVMLDMDKKFTDAAMAQLVKQNPAPLFSKAALTLIETGTFEQDLKKISDCDWVVEVVKEDLKIKQSLFARVEPLLKPGAIVSSNTSGLSIKGMTDGRSAAFKKNFLVTHFFNPVRYMRLLELVAGEETDPAVMKRFADFGEHVLGKGIVYGKDTTNFIANRIGTYGMMRVLARMQEAGFSIEEVDKIFGPAMGRPKSAVFRTADLVGLDTFLHVTKNCYDSLTNDDERDTFKPPQFLLSMVEKGMLGDKTQGGFYKKDKKGEGDKQILALDLKTLEYRPQAKVRFDSLGAVREIESLPERMAALLKHGDKASQFAEVVTLETLAYASRHLTEIADDYVNVDRAMRWGFAWDIGPFEAWDAIGVKHGLERMKALNIKPAAWVEEMVKAGKDRFYSVDGIQDVYWDVKKRAPAKVSVNPHNVSIEVLKRGNQRIAHNDSASLWDMGDGACLLEFHSKMNSIDDQITEMMEKAVDTAEAQFKTLVVGNDGTNFSVGANIGGLMMAIGAGEWEVLRTMIRRFQAANQRLRYSPVPVVTAPFQMTLGGGCEVTMAGNAIQASAETYIGLVEVGVGLIPGGGGNLQLMRNVFGAAAGSKDFDALPFLKKLFLTIGMAKVATSAEEAKEAGFMSAQDGISMSRDALLGDAKARGLGMADGGFMPPRPTTFLLPGRSGAATIDMLLYDMELNHQISEHDRKIGRKLASVLTGGDTSPSAVVTEQQLLDLELEAFLSLCGEEKTQARIMYMLEKGKPLRN